MHNGHDLDRARDALNALDPACDRDTWHRYGWAAIAAGPDLDDLDQWSSRADNYKGTKDVRAAFKTVAPDGGTGAGSLYFFARAEGWSDTTERNGHPMPPQARARPAEAAKPNTVQIRIIGVGLWAR